MYIYIYIGLSLCPVTVTTRIIIFLVGDPNLNLNSFATGILGGDNPIYDEPPKPACLKVFMVNNQVFRWPKPLFFMDLGARETVGYLASSEAYAEESIEQAKGHVKHAEDAVEEVGGQLSRLTIEFFGRIPQVYPPPSNSHHQDYYIFSRESL